MTRSALGVIIIVMIMINIFEAKAKLSEYLEAVSQGKRVMICNRNKPVAELRAVAAMPTVRRLGAAAGAVTIPPSFFDALPDDVLDAFDGSTPRAADVPRVAEPKSSYAGRKKRRA